MYNQKVTLPNGKIVEISQDTYNRILEESDPKLFYNSESKGKTKIAEMADDHLKNAMLKIFRQLVEGELLKMKGQSLKEVHRKLSKGFNFNNEVLNTLHEEAGRRVHQNKYRYMF